MHPLRSAIGSTLVISMNHQAGTSAVSLGNRFSKATVLGVASSLNSQDMATERSTTNTQRSPAALDDVLRHRSQEELLQDELQWPKAAQPILPVSGDSIEPLGWRCASEN